MIDGELIEFDIRKEDKNLVLTVYMPDGTIIRYRASRKRELLDKLREVL